MTQKVGEEMSHSASSMGREEDVGIGRLRIRWKGVNEGFRAMKESRKSAQWMLRYGLKKSKIFALAKTQAIRSNSCIAACWIK